MRWRYDREARSTASIARNSSVRTAESTQPGEAAAEVDSLDAWVGEAECCDGEVAVVELLADKTIGIHDRTLARTAASASLSSVTITSLISRMCWGDRRSSIGATTGSEQESETRTGGCGS